MERKIMIYALSTCIWCKKTLEYFKGKKIRFEHVFVDLLDEPEQSRVIAEMESYNPQGNFPTVVIDGRIVTGYDTARFEEELKK